MFPSGCAYHGQVKFASGGVTLDCNSSSIEGSLGGHAIVKPVEPGVAGTVNNPHVRYARYHELEGTSLEPLLAGVVVAARERLPGGCRTAGPAVEDIAIRNCTVRGFFQGIRLEREFEEEKDESGACKQLGERRFYTGYDRSQAQQYSYAEEYALERSALYSRAPKSVRIVNSTVERNGHAGIYVIAYSQFFSIEGTTIRNNGGVGIYLSHETRYNTVNDSSIVHNGWGALDAEVGYTVPGVAEVQPKSREGIAIDSSAHNTLSKNRITDNYKAGISLYKNCGESDAAARPATIRKQHADHNRIVHNTIARHANRSGGKDEKSGYGIWIATRQGQLFDPKPGATKHCRDPYATTPRGEKRNRDYANFNAVEYNSFEDNWCSVRVADDFNQIVGNEFRGATKYDLYIGNSFRAELGLPVRGTTVVKNRSWTTTGNAGNGSKLRCLDVSGGEPFNDCARPR